MTTMPTAPGVYVRELPGGSRAIAGVSTSLTAFVGRARRGPVGAPTKIASATEYDRRFGGLWDASPMSQAVRHYFLNGGSEALIVRVVNGDSEGGDAAATAHGTIGVGVVLAATEEAVALEGFDHLRATVSGSDAGAGTFDLTVAAVGADDAVLSDGDTDVDITVSLDVAGDYAAALAAAVTATVPAVPLAAVAGGALLAAPADGTVDGEGALLTLATTALHLEAADPGAWGDAVQVRAVYEDAGPGAFHLLIEEVDDQGAVVRAETHYNVVADPRAPRSVARILERRSELARVDDIEDADDPALPVGPEALDGGADGAAPRITEDVLGDAGSGSGSGIHALVTADAFNLLCIPLASWSQADAAHTALWAGAAQLCERHRAVLLIDPPAEWEAFPSAADAQSFSPRSPNAALYFPRIMVPDPLREGRLAEFPPSGAVAGVIARTDAQRGVWKAPAGIDAGLRGVPELTVAMTDSQHGDLNQLGINGLRTFPVYGRVVWGARTLEGADVQASQWKYLPVRRLALYLEESLYRGTQWAVFEPNDEALWSQLRLSIGSFLHGLFRQGAFQGASPNEAYLVRCDAETTTQSDIDRGIVNVLIGFAPLRPAEFVIIKLQQLAAQAG